MRFADAITVFGDSMAITIEDDFLDEERFVTIGIDVLQPILVVVYTLRDEDVRIISARKATLPEQQFYNGEQ